MVLYYKGRYKCKSCTNSRKQIRNPVTTRKYHLKARFNLTPDQVDQMKIAQNNICPICKLKTELVVDHCHATNKIRGMLCSLCNAGLGKIGDNKEGVINALKYLEVPLLSEKEYGHREYIITMTFDDPRSGPVNIVAKDEEAALEQMSLLYGHLKNMQVVNIVPVDDIKPTAMDEVAAMMGTAPDKKVH